MIYMGYDAREDLAYRVAKHSFEKYGYKVVPLVQKQLRDKFLFTRPWRVNEDGQWIDERSNTPISTEFSFSRFLVPFLAQEDWALFVDCDVLCRTNPKYLFDLADPKYAVQVCKHDFKSPNSRKMDNIAQVNYSNKKLWSSVVLWNLKHPSNKKLTLGQVNHENGKFLHEFQWLDESEIGDLPLSWNYIPEHTLGRADIVHWTEGGPWFPEYQYTLFSHEWHLEKLQLLEQEAAEQRAYCKFL